MNRLALVLILASIAWPQVTPSSGDSFHFQQGRQRLTGVRPSSGCDRGRQPEKLVQTLQLAPGATVADLGTGTGFLVPYLAEAVGSEGRVLAQDISNNVLDRARKMAEGKQLANVEFILGAEKDPKLPEGEVDLVVTVSAYHHFDYPAEMLAGIRKALREGGRLAIVDFYKRNFNSPSHIRLEKEDMIREVEAHGFRLVSDHDHIPEREYVVVFERR